MRIVSPYSPGQCLDLLGEKVHRGFFPYWSGKPLKGGLWDGKIQVSKVNILKSPYQSAFYADLAEHGQGTMISGEFRLSHQFYTFLIQNLVLFIFMPLLLFLFGAPCDFIGLYAFFMVFLLCPFYLIHYKIRRIFSKKEQLFIKSSLMDILNAQDAGQY